MPGRAWEGGLEEFLLDLYDCLLQDAVEQYKGESKSLQRDLATIRSRVSKEGVSFLTKALPRFGKAFDRGLETECFVAPDGFKPAKGARIPAFLQGIVKHVFNPDGSLGIGDASAIALVRQICYCVYKLELPYHPQQKRDVINAFLATEEELSSFTFDDTLCAQIRRVVSDVLEGFDPKDILPRHGPGAVATGEVLEEKWVFSRLYSDIHAVYPYYEYYVVGGATELLDRIEWYRGLDRQSTGVARVVLVPKDSRGPRLISCEPLEYQWIQQGLNRSLVRWLEGNPLTAGRINFADQTTNRSLARESSRHGYFATLDLKDASDRVSVELVRRTFPKELLKYFLAVRSHATLLPDGGVVTLNKYAPMGSAVCFSVEALLFWAISVVAVEVARNDDRTSSAEVFVYGDDIIVPADCFTPVTEALTRCGLKVNLDKSFRHGKFRESCGMDAYDGVDVTPTRLSTVWSCSTTDGAVLAAYTSYANSFARKGYEHTSEYLFGAVDACHQGLPFGLATSGYPNRHVETVLEAARLNEARGIPVRFNRQLQRMEAKVKTLSPRRVPSCLDGWSRLLRNLSAGGAGEDPSVVTLPRSARIVRRWSAI